MNRAAPEESRGGPLNYSDADWRGLVPSQDQQPEDYKRRIVQAAADRQQRQLVAIG